MTSVSKKEALALLKKYNVNQHVMEHVMAVHDYAMEIAAAVECDRGLVEAGSLLHDIGRSMSHGIDHAIIGAEILKKEGVDGRIVSIVERHIGAGLTAREAKKLGLPPKDYAPRTIEEKIVCPRGQSHRQHRARFDTGYHRNRARRNGSRSPWTAS